MACQYSGDIVKNIIERISMRLAPYDLPLILFFLSAVIAVLPAYDPHLSVKTLIAYGICALIYWVLAHGISHQRGWRIAALTLAVLAILFS